MPITVDLAALRLSVNFLLGSRGRELEDTENYASSDSGCCKYSWWGGHDTGGQGIFQLSRATGESKRSRISMSLPLRWETESLPGRAISGQHRGDYPENMTLVKSVESEEVWSKDLCCSLEKGTEVSEDLRGSWEELAGRGSRGSLQGAVITAAMTPGCSSCPPSFEGLGKHRLC